jgi:hypothetical protein
VSFELTTSDLQDRHRQLCYVGKSGDPGRDPTCGLRVRTAALFAAKLQGQKSCGGETRTLTSWVKARRATNYRTPQYMWWSE